MPRLPIQNMKVGDKHITPAKMVTKTDIETFCSVTGMLHPLFLSDQYVNSDEESQKIGLKGSVVPGQLAYAIMLGNLLRDETLDDVIVQLGANNIRWPAPAYPYDMLRTEIEITGNRVTKEGKKVIVDYKWQVKNQNDVVVVEGNNTCLFKKK